MADATDDFLEHFGIKGMKWGRRKVNVPKLGTAKKGPVSEDSAHAKATAEKLRKSGISSLSNSELRKLNERMQLEQNYSNLLGQQKSAVDKGHNHVKSIMSIAGTAQQVYGFYNSPLGKMLTAEVKQRVFSK